LQHVTEEEKGVGGLLRAPPEIEQVAEIVERPDVAGVSRDDTPVGVLRVGQFLLLAQDIAKIEKGVCKLRIDSRCVAKRGFRVGETPQHGEGIAEIAVSRRAVVLHAYRFSDQVGGGLVIPPLVGEQAKIVQCIGVFRLLRQDLPITGFGLAEPPGLVQTQRLLQQLAELRRGIGHFEGQCHGLDSSSLVARGDAGADSRNTSERLADFLAPDPQSDAPARDTPFDAADQKR